MPIDIELCVYRKINDSYDIEVSGTRLKGKPMTVYVWDITGGKHNGARIIETVRGIIGVPALKAVLDGIVRKYTEEV